MAKFKITEKKAKLAVVVGGILILAVIITIAVCSGGRKSTTTRLDEKIAAEAAKNGVSIEEIKNDKELIEQLKMDAAQEEKIDKLTENITVTDKEISDYRDMIGNTMDTKKAVLILFNTADECQSFIDENGSKDKPETLNLGVLPLMETDNDGQKYYNVVGNDMLETAFDSLKDGEYTKAPVEFAGVYCYLKRIGIDSPMQSSEEIKELIKSEKAHELLQKENKNGGK